MEESPPLVFDDAFQGTDRTSYLKYSLYSPAGTTLGPHLDLGNIIFYRTCALLRAQSGIIMTDKYLPLFSFKIPKTNDNVT